MNRSIFALAIALVTFMASCSKSNSTEATEAGAVAQTSDSSSSYTLDANASTVKWTGAKLREVKHTGSIAIEEGSISATNGVLTAARCVINMKTIKELDNNDMESATKLAGHLSSPDFFNADSFPTATFELVEVIGQNERAKGNLTIKGITKMIEVPLTVTTMESGLNVQSHFVINRNDWGITWGSKLQPIAFLKDNLVSDDIEFDLNLVAVK